MKESQGECEEINQKPLFPGEHRENDNLPYSLSEFFFF